MSAAPVKRRRKVRPKGGGAGPARGSSRSPAAASSPRSAGRNRVVYAVAAVAVVALGLASRRWAAQLPAFVAAYAGDTLWALGVFVGVGFLMPRWTSLRVAAVALAISWAVEVSQLYHAPWIDDIRHTRVGGLVLGYGFLWSDLACYAAGVVAGFAAEAMIAEVLRSSGARA